MVQGSSKLEVRETCFRNSTYWPVTCLGVRIPAFPKTAGADSQSHSCRGGRDGHRPGVGTARGVPVVSLRGTPWTFHSQRQKWKLQYRMGLEPKGALGPYSQPLLMKILRSLPEYLHVAIKPLKFP